jgi:hypothetical protein
MSDLNPAHGLDLSGVAACLVRLAERLLGLGLAARSSREAALVLRMCRARRAEAGPTPVAVRQWSGGATRPMSCTTRRERERRVRWGSRRSRRGTASGSPVKANDGGGADSRKDGGGGRSEALAFEADEPIFERMGEVAACLNTGAKERGKKRGAGQRPTAFDHGRARGREEKDGAQGGGSGRGLGATWL